MKIIVRWLLLAAALLLVAYLYPGVTVTSFGSAMIAAFVIGVFNTLLRPLLVLLTLPVTLLTLGLFLFVINALMFWAAAQVLDGFAVAGFVRRADRLADLQPVRHGDRRGDGTPVQPAAQPPDRRQPRRRVRQRRAAHLEAHRLQHAAVAGRAAPARAGPATAPSAATRPARARLPSSTQVPRSPSKRDALRRRRDVGVEREARCRRAGW